MSQGGGVRRRGVWVAGREKWERAEGWPPSRGRPSEGRRRVEGEVGADRATREITI